MTQHGHEALIFSFSISSLINAIIALCGGLFADVAGRKRMLLISATSFTIGTALITAHLKLFIFFGAILILVSPAIARGAYNSLLSESVPRNLRGRVFSTGSFISLIGTSLGSALFGFLMENIGLNPTLTTVAVLAATGAILRLAIVETKGRIQYGVDISSSQILNVIRELFLSRELAPLTIMAIIMGFIGQLFHIFLPIYLSNVLKFDAELVGIVFSFLTISQAIGQPFSGFFIDKFGEVKALVLDVLVSASSTSLFILSSIVVPTLSPTFLFLNTFFSAFTAIALFTYVARITHESRRATTYGFLTSMGSLSSLPAPIVGRIL
ncbi:MAG: MFS transporter, partial [Thermoproteota archaeon]